MKILYAILFLLVFEFNNFGDSNSLVEDALPFVINTNQIKPLRQLIDFTLQASLEKKLNENSKWKKLIESKQMAVGVVDIRDPYKVKFARVNGNDMMYAASLPKIAVLLTAEQAFEDGDLNETNEIKDDMRLMIAKSDNAASTRMIDRLGYKKIEQVLTDPRYDLYDEEYGGGLWVGKRYASDGPRYPDPIMGLSHSATVSQVCRFYYLMAFGQLVSFERSEEMLEIMSDPELHHKFVNSIEQIDPNAKLYRKSGTWQNYHSDSILVWGDGWRRYILVALIEDPNGEAIIRNLLPEVEEILKPQTK
ncbi:MAG: serine hydrolase [Ignavibacteriae bacterium]|nr:serine hydrolase [Ignavibacteriota bacterium]MCB9208322.1 serine hydrolase [Ignavibacteriales bacterium]MCB9259084.1 serine hydrolase [Ignavibacteriales bacterium]